MTQKNNGEKELDFNFEAGTDSSVDEILKFIIDEGLPFYWPEIESFIRDDLFNGIESSEAVIDRVISHRDTVFGSIEREIKFRKLITIQWNRIKENYDPDRDALFRKFRRQAFKYIDFYTRWIKKLNDSGNNFSDLPTEDMLDIIGGHAKLITMMENFNSDAPLDKKDDPDEIMNRINKIGNMIQEKIADLGSF